MKSTQEDFERFQREGQRLINLFGKFDWHVCWEWEALFESEGTYEFDLENRVIAIRLDKGDIVGTPEQIARHEVIEGLLLGKLKMMAMTVKWSEEQIQEEVHVITRILEKIL